jgi:hypothetical protein
VGGRIAGVFSPEFEVDRRGSSPVGVPASVLESGTLDRSFTATEPLLEVEPTAITTEDHGYSSSWINLLTDTQPIERQWDDPVESTGN